MSEFVDRLIRAIKAGGSDAGPAAEALAALLELRVANYQPPGNDGGWGAIIGDDLVRRGLSAAEADTAISGLLDLIDSSTEPRSDMIWPLLRSRDARMLPALVRAVGKLLRKTTGRRYSGGNDADSAVGNALEELQFFAYEGDRSALDALRLAVLEGSGELQARAAELLDDVVRGRRLRRKHVRLRRARRRAKRMKQAPHHNI